MMISNSVKVYCASFESNFLLNTLIGSKIRNIETIWIHDIISKLLPLVILPLLKSINWCVAPKMKVMKITTLVPNFHPFCEPLFLQLITSLTAIIPKNDVRIIIYSLKNITGIIQAATIIPDKILCCFDDKFFTTTPLF